GRRDLSERPSGAMSRSLPKSLVAIGVPFVAAAWILAARLIWEQTVWSWNSGPQMVGFSLMHSSIGALLVLASAAGVLWAVATLIVMAIKRTTGGRWAIGLLLAYGLAWGALTIPYGFWQRMFIGKYSQEHAVQFLTMAAATGDMRTVQAFLDRGI